MVLGIYGTFSGTSANGKQLCLCSWTRRNKNQTKGEGKGLRIVARVGNTTAALESVPSNVKDIFLEEGFLGALQPRFLFAR